MKRFLILCFCGFLLSGSAWAQGHMLHGVGPINSSMGGAGTGLPEDPVAALMYNPALLGAEPGNQITFSNEFFTTAIHIDVNAFGRTGNAKSTPALGIVPAFGWMFRHPDQKLGIGFGLIGVAGFQTDYAHQPGTIIFDKAAEGGFGRIFTDYIVAKIPIGFSYQASPKLTIGASLNVYRANLAIAPLPYEVFDDVAPNTNSPVAPDGTRFFPQGGNQNGRFAISGQVGVFYKPNDMLSFGASLLLPQNYSPFEWNSYHRDPTDPSFGDHLDLEYDLDGPLMVTVGTGIKPNEKTQIAIDGTWTKYKGVEGFGSPGGIVNGIVQPFGWRNVFSVKAGVRYQATEKVDVRAGYAFTQMPLQSKNVLTATGAPATFQNHFTGGMGIKVFPFLTLQASGYIVPRESVSGPYLIDQLGPNPPTTPGTMKTSNKITSGTMGFYFTF
jgi:long-chain fatty acid transport protein